MYVYIHIYIYKYIHAFMYLTVCGSILDKLYMPRCCVHHFTAARDSSMELDLQKIMHIYPTSNIHMYMSNNMICKCLIICTYIQRYVPTSNDCKDMFKYSTNLAPQ